MGGNNRNNKNNTYRNQNRNSAAVKARSASAAEAAEQRSRGTELFLIIFAAVALVGIIASVIIAIFAGGSGKRVDYMNDNLGKYVYVSPDDYLNITADALSVEPISELDLEVKILSLLAKHKGEVKYGGKFVKNQNINAGDVVYIYYRGYTLNEDGSRNYFDGGCNFSSTDPSELEIGSGNFVKGFEYNMIGKNPKDYSTITKYGTSGSVGATDKVYVTYTRKDSSGTSVSGAKTVDLSRGKEAIDAEWDIGFYDGITSASYGLSTKFNAYGDFDSEYTVTVYRVTDADDIIEVTFSAYFFDGGVKQGQTAIIDLNDPAVDTKYGTGFRDFFKNGVPVGYKASIVDPETGKDTTLKCSVGEGEMNAFYDITVKNVYDIGDNPMTVEAYFPLSYGEESLQGKWSTFEVYVMKSKEYEPAEYNDAFVTEKLKVSAESLAGYGGETLVEKHRNFLLEELIEENKTAEDNAKNEIIFAYLVEKAKVKKLHKADVRDYYNSYYNSINQQFTTSYSSYYESVDAFACDYLGLAAKSDWQAELKKMAETAVTEKLIFYYVMHDGGFVFPEAEYETRKAELLEDYLKETLKNANIDRADYDTEAKYLEKVEEYRANILNYYTEDMLRETIAYEYALEQLREYVTVAEQ